MITAAGEDGPPTDEDRILEDIDPVVAVPHDGTLADDIRKVIARRAANMVESYLSGADRPYWPSPNAPVQYGTPVQYGQYQPLFYSGPSGPPGHISAGCPPSFYPVNYIQYSSAPMPGTPGLVGPPLPPNPPVPGGLPLPLYYQSKSAPGLSNGVMFVASVLIGGHAAVELLFVPLDKAITQVCLVGFSILLACLESSFIPGHGTLLRQLETWCKVLVRPKGRGVMAITLSLLYASTIRLTLWGLVVIVVMFLVGLNRIL